MIELWAAFIRVGLLEYVLCILALLSLSGLMMSVALVLRSERQFNEIEF